MPIDEKDIERLTERLARLAQIELVDEDRRLVAGDLERIIAMVDAMQSVDTRGVAPLAHPLDATQPTRVDAVTERNDRERFLDLAPSSEDGLYVVPLVVE